MAYQYKREPLNSEETTKLMNACKNGKEKLIVWTLLETGLRVSELAALRKENINWMEATLIVFGKGGPFGKKTKRRVVPMSEKVKTLLGNYFALEDEFKLGKRWIQKIIKAVGNRACITKPVTAHILRHTFAVNCLKRGINIKTLQLLLGHDTLETTQIYLNMSPQEAIYEFQKKWK